MAVEPFLINPINPHRRHKRRKSRRKARKNLSLGLLGNPKRKRKVRRVRHVAARKVRRVRRRRAAIPRRAIKKVRRLHMARKRRSRRARRNPALGLSLRGFQSKIGDAAWLAGGAIGVGVLSNLLPLPVQLRVGWLRHATKAGLAIATGALISRVAGSSAANLVTLGALSGVVLDVVNEFSARSGLALPAPAASGVSGLGAFPAYEERSLEHYTGMGHYTGVEMGMYGSYLS